MVDQRSHTRDQDEQNFRPQDVRAGVVGGSKLDEDEIDGRVRGDEEEDLEGEERREFGCEKVHEPRGEDQRQQELAVP